MVGTVYTTNRPCSDSILSTCLDSAELAIEWMTDPLLSLYDAAIQGADPAEATAHAIDQLQIPRERRVMIFAIGKAAAPMATATVGALLK